MRLTGVGVGPGDPELVTVKAVRMLREADVVLVPVAADGPPAEEAEPGYAERVVTAHLPALQVRRVPFSLGAPSRRAANWGRAADIAGEVLAHGGHVAFATIGDPNLYATFSYLAATVRQRWPSVAIETVPGITALQDLAARSGTVLAEGEETLALLPLAAGPDRLARALDEHDTVVAYKGGRHLPAVRDVLAASGRLDDAVYGARLGLDGEELGPLPAGRAAPYLSTVIVSRHRRHGGGIDG